MKRYNTKQKEMNPIISVIIFILIIATAVGVYFVKDHNATFLLAYLIPLILIIAFGKKLPKQLGIAARILVGCLFIFSGFVKGVDPIGMAYKIEDYLLAYNMPVWMLNFSMILSVGINLVEFLIGIMLLFNIKLKFTLIIATLMMAFFTTTTLLDATMHFVSDCGCFGEAVKMTEWQTFYKNLTINLFIIILWFTHKKIKPTFYPNAEIGIATVVGILFVGLEIYSLIFLPPIDFRDWKVGNDMKSENQVPIIYKVKYQNNTTKEEAILNTNDIPFNDSIWMNSWTFVDQVIIDNNVHPHELALFDQDGENETVNVISDPNPNILIISYYIENVKIEKFEKLMPIIDYCHQEGYNVYFISASEYEVYEHIAEILNLDAYFYNADDIELKTMIRSNPGIIAMENGIVMKKWSINNVPSLEKFTKVFE
ncbi:hypothetical protein LJC69_06330 [Bacteroidales bacterium OttesenSCG-928-K22]|nr:hypothetical protein [Bacteroidales bacterium OttesenSCG-928-L14]MDL2241225.1 hypothetical protein [Bacteroidales bacterium OttesenSCG-928-K22]